MRIPRLSRILVATLAASVLASGVALADSISVDGSATGDMASPPSGVWAPGDCSQAFTMDGLVTVSYNNSGGQGHYTPGEPLSVSVVVTHGQTVTTSITSAPKGSASVPAGWGADSSFTIPITTSVGAPLAHDSYKVTYTVAGRTSAFSATDLYIVHVCDGTTPPPPPPPPVDPCAGASTPALPVFTETGGTAGDNGWWKAAPAVSASSGDAAITYATGATAGTYGPAAPTLTDGTTVVWAMATNSCGLSSSNSKSYSVDSLAPSISHTVAPASSDGANGWYVTGPLVSFNCTDATSGLAATAGCVVDGTSSNSITLGESANEQTVHGTARDNAGWTSTDSAGPFHVDLSDPVLNITDSNSGTSSICAGRPARPAFAPADAISGLASNSDAWSTPANASGVGTYSYTADAQDNAGRKAHASRTYNVTYGGAVAPVPFLQPINTDGSSRFKLGSTIPVKFQALCGTAPISSVVAKLYVAQTDSSPDPGSDEAISTSAATTGNLFRYDTTGQQYIFNLSTKAGYTNPDGTTTGFSAGTWYLKMLLDDGTWRSIKIQIVR